MKQNNGYEKNSDFYKLAYDPICVSEEMKFKLRRLHMNQTKKSYFHVLKMTVAAAAAICLLFTGLVNGSTAFAASVEKIPVVGKIAKLVLFRSYFRRNARLCNICFDSCSYRE